jgi:hypothetical protein
MPSSTFPFSAICEQVADHVDDRLHGPVDDRGHRRREPDALADLVRLDADDEHPVDGPVDADAAGQPVERPEDGRRVHAVGIPVRRLGLRAVRGRVQVVFEQVERARLAAAADRVDQDEGVVAVEQPVGQVHPADADVGDLHAGRQLAHGEPARHLDTEPVVGEEDVADARDQNPVHPVPPFWATSISSGWK